MNFLGRFTAIIYFLMRVMVGLMFACHGAAKLLDWFPDPKHPAAAHALDTMTMIGGSIELIGGLLIAIGLLTPIAAFLASGMMAVAFFMVHAQMGSIVPYVNKGELAVVYCFVFLYISAHGAGPWSLDALLFRNRQEHIGSRLSPL
ncbi:MAG: DoxX family protein [Verrucomicrobiota bacterium]|nr:DoxX family protein [Verrucomicrobiota bacterium]